MVAFEVYNATLWNIVMQINNAENESCTMQIATPLQDLNNFVSFYPKRNDNRLLDTAISMMIAHSIPLVLVDIKKEFGMTRLQRIRNLKTDNLVSIM